MKSASWVLLGLSLLGGGCGDAGGSAEPPGETAAQRRARLCAPSTAPRRTTVVSRFGFVRASTEMPTVAQGFDLDGRVSTTSDAMGCRQADFTSPEGAEGVDNQLARLLPIVDGMTGGAFDGAIQAAVNNGQLLLAVSVEGADDPTDDPCVTLVVERVAGMPFVGADMFLDKGQTYDLLREEPVTRVPATLTGGVVEAGPFLFPLPIAVLDARLVLNLYGARFRARMREDGGMEGLIGGGMSLAEFSAEVSRLTIPSGQMATFTTALRVFADLAPVEGRCTQVSAGITFDARSAFVNP